MPTKTLPTPDSAQLFPHMPLITRSLGGGFYIPEETGGTKLTPEQVIIRVQNFFREHIADLNAFYAATKTPTRWLTRCCYCDAIIDPNSYQTLRLRLAGKDAYLWSEAIEDAYWDEEFPRAKEAPDKTLPGGVVLRDETVESFHHKIRQCWMSQRDNWTMEAEHMQRTAFRRVVLHLGFVPGATLKEQAPEWIAATPRHLFST